MSATDAAKIFVKNSMMAEPFDRHALFWSIFEWICPITNTSVTLPTPDGAFSFDPAAITGFSPANLSLAKKLVHWFFTPSADSALWLIKVVGNRADKTDFGTVGNIAKLEDPAAPKGSLEDIPDGMFRTLVENGVDWISWTQINPLTSATSSMNTAQKDLWTQGFESSENYRERTKIPHLQQILCVRMATTFERIRPNIFILNPQMAVAATGGGTVASTSGVRLTDYGKVFSSIKMEHVSQDGTPYFVIRVLDELTRIQMLLNNVQPHGCTPIDIGNALLASMLSNYKSHYATISTEWTRIKSLADSDAIKLRKFWVTVIIRIACSNRVELPQLLKGVHQNNLLYPDKSVKQCLDRWKSHDIFLQTAIEDDIYVAVSDNRTYTHDKMVLTLRMEMRVDPRYKSHPTNYNPSSVLKFTEMETMFASELDHMSTAPLQQPPSLNPSSHAMYGVHNQTPACTGACDQCHGGQTGVIAAVGVEDTKVMMALQDLQTMMQSVQESQKSLTEEVHDVSRRVEIQKCCVQTLSAKVDPNYGRENELLAAVASARASTTTSNATSSTTRRFPPKRTAVANQPVERTKVDIDQVEEPWRTAVKKKLETTGSTMESPCVICKSTRRAHVTSDCGWLFMQTEAGRVYRTMMQERNKGREFNRSQLQAALATAPSDTCDPDHDMAELFGRLEEDGTVGPLKGSMSMLLLDDAGAALDYYYSVHGHSD